jgi:hypothetical protein
VLDAEFRLRDAVLIELAGRNWSAVQRRADVLRAMQRD